jgi:hypothetical protein
MASLIILILSEIAKAADKKRERRKLARQQFLTTETPRNLLEELPAYQNSQFDMPPPSYEAATFSLPSDAPSSLPSSSQSPVQSQQQSQCSPYHCNPPLPKHILDTIDWNQEPLGLIKPYFRHVLLCVTEGYMSWPPEIVDLNNATQEVWHVCKDATDLLVEDGLDKSLARIAFNAIQYPGSDDNLVKLLIFPDQVSVKISIDQVSELVDLLASKQRITPFQNNLGLEVTELEDMMRVFVCVHNQRDERCGVLGSRILSSLPTSSRGKPVIGVGVSHVGGHKWAGNMVVYNEYKAKWFGRVHPGNVVAVLDSDVSSDTCRGCFDW